MSSNTPSIRLTVTLSEAIQLCEDFQTLESDFRILQGAFDIKIPTNAAEYKSVGLSSGLVFYELNERARKLVKTVQRREVVQGNTRTHPAEIIKEQTEHDNLSNTFGQMKQDLKSLRIKFEGSDYFQYPTASRFQLIGNQMAPPSMGKSKKKGSSKKNNVPSNKLAGTSPVLSPMAKIKINTDIQKTENPSTQSPEQLPTPIENDLSISTETLSTNPRRSSRTQSRSRTSLPPSTSLSDPPTDISEDVLTSLPKALPPNSHQTLQDVLRKSINETPGAINVLNPDGTFKFTTPASGALSNKTTPTSSPVMTRKRSREIESFMESNKPKKSKIGSKIANFPYDGGELEPKTSAQTIWERKYSTLPPAQQAVKDIAFDNTMRLAASLAEDLKFVRDQNCKLQERVKKLNGKLAKYESKIAAVIPKKRKRSVGREAGEKGDKSFRPPIVVEKPLEMGNESNCKRGKQIGPN
jgi:hypothetical protein